MGTRFRDGSLRAARGPAGPARSQRAWRRANRSAVARPVTDRRRPRWPAAYSGSAVSSKMAGVVDALDSRKLAAVPLDLVNAGGAEVEPVQGAERDAESPAQQ